MRYDKLLMPYTHAQIDQICGHLRQVSKNAGCRTELSTGEVMDGPWAGQILSAAIDYRVTYWEIENTPEKVLPDDSEINALRAELFSFRRSVRRGFKNKKKLCRRYRGLSRDARNLVRSGGIAADRLWERSQAESKGPVPDRTLWLARIEKAIEFASETPGPKPNGPLFELIDRLASIYEEATGRTPGRGYNDLERSYQGPFEEFLELCLNPLLERPITIDSIRGYIRKLNAWRQILNEVAERRPSP